MYFWKNSCAQLCPTWDTRACNEQSCPINCILTEFGPWSDCSPCAKKQARKWSSVSRTICVSLSVSVFLSMTVSVSVSHLFFSDWFFLSVCVLLFVSDCLDSFEPGPCRDRPSLVGQTVTWSWPRSVLVTPPLSVNCPRWTVETTSSVKTVEF